LPIDVPDGASSYVLDGRSHSTSRTPRDLRDEFGDVAEHIWAAGMPVACTLDCSQSVVVEADFDGWAADGSLTGRMLISVVEGRAVDVLDER
jgi:hypothetical protein